MNPISWSLQESKSNLKTNPALEFNRGSRFPGFQSGFEWPSSVMNLNLYIHIIIYRYVCVCIYIYYYYYIQPTTKKKQLCLWYRFQPVWGTARRRWWLPRNGLVSPSHCTNWSHGKCWLLMWHEGIEPTTLGIWDMIQSMDINRIYRYIYIYIYKQRLAPRMACPKTRNLR
jgi:hypothetical protein